MNTLKNMLLRRWALALLCVATYSGLQAQQAPATPAPSATAPAVDDEVLVLSPFEVSSEKDTGYTATETLAGTRVRTDLRDIASSLSVVTSQFLRDTGATSNSSLLPYQVNTEVGGLMGNFAGVGNTQTSGENGKLANPNSNTRVRGLDSADNTRDYFISDIPWDSYVVDRVDLQRGPNSILFGVGSPAGIVNVTTVGARFDKNAGKIEATFGSYGSQRYNLDYNQVLIKGELALRIAAVDDDSKYRQDPAYSHAKRVFASTRFTPQVFSKDIAGKLSVRINAEKGRVDSNNPRWLPPIDKITNFFNPAIFARTNGKVNLYDANYSWNYGQNLDRGTRANSQDYVKWRASEPGYMAIPGLSHDMFAGFITYNNGTSNPILVRDLKATSTYGINSSGVIDSSINGMQFSNLQGVAGLYEYAKNVNSINPALYPAATKDVWKDQSITDASIFDFYNKLFDGNNKREWQDFNVVNAAVSQNFLNNRVGIEAVFDRQNYTSGQEGINYPETSGPYITVDVNRYTADTVASYFPHPNSLGANPWAPDVNNGGGTVNPNAGRAFTTGTGYGNSNQNIRQDWRLTAYGELDGRDIFAKDSFWAKLFNRNVLSALASSDRVDSFSKNWDLERTDANFPLSKGQLTPGQRNFSKTIYLTGNLTSTASAAGLNIDRLQSVFDGYGAHQVRYFDSHWNKPTNPASAGYVDPAALTYVRPSDQLLMTQSENPDNYVGWKTQAVNILSSRHGEIDQLYTGATKRRQQIDSEALTLQSYFWKDAIIGTYGWRKDKIESYRTRGTVTADTQVASVDFTNDRNGTQAKESFLANQGQTKTWGVVARLPRDWRGKLPHGLDFSAFYNNSNNFRPETRIGFDGYDLPSPSGSSKDYGIAVTALDDRVSLKLTWFDTKVLNTNLGGDLGGSIWFLRNMQIWGSAKYLKMRAGFLGLYNNDYGAWNQTAGVSGKWGAAVDSPEFLNDPETLKMRNFMTQWIATLPSQEYFNNMGFGIGNSSGIDVAKLGNSD
ncbi:MAG: TonB-dependent receptor plug domain-containing protein, partial [Opitutae bacterium]